VATLDTEACEQFLGNWITERSPWAETIRQRRCSALGNDYVVRNSELSDDIVEMRLCGWHRRYWRDQGLEVIRAPVR